MISEEQIQDLIDTNDSYTKEFFVWQMNPDNIDIEIFYAECIEPDLEEAVIALMQHTGNFYDDCEKAIEDEAYFVLTEKHAEQKARDYTECYVDEALREMPQHLERYFDSELYIDDLIEDRGVLLAPYDGNEHYEEVNGTTYYIYQQ